MRREEAWEGWILIASYLLMIGIFGAGQILDLKKRGLFNRREIFRVSLGLSGLISFICGACPPFMATNLGIGMLLAAIPLVGTFLGMTFWEELIMFLGILAVFALVLAIPAMPFLIVHFTMGANREPQTVAAGFMATLIWIGCSYLLVRTLIRRQGW